jgi:hypothetical protein
VPAPEEEPAEVVEQNAPGAIGDSWPAAPGLWRASSGSYAAPLASLYAVGDPFTCRWYLVSGPSGALSGPQRGLAVSCQPPRLDVVKKGRRTTARTCVGRSALNSPTARVEPAPAIELRLGLESDEHGKWSSGRKRP